MRHPLALLLVALALACSSKKKTDEPEEDPAQGGPSEVQLESKATEAKVSLNAIARAVKTYYLENEKLPASAPLTPPPGSCCRSDSKTCAPDPSLWSGGSWGDLMFSLSDPHRYSYELATDASGFTARAIGDLDCDGQLSTYELTGTLENGSLTTGAITEKDPLE